MTDPQQALLAALEAAGLPVKSITAEQLAMFAGLSDEEVTRLLELRARPEPADPALDAPEAAGDQEPTAATDPTAG
jgi:hypothetical protein